MWLGLRVGGHLALLYLHQMNRVNSHNDLGHDQHYKLRRAYYYKNYYYHTYWTARLNANCTIKELFSIHNNASMPHSINLSTCNYRVYTITPLILLLVFFNWLSFLRHHSSSVSVPVGLPKNQPSDAGTPTPGHTSRSSHGSVVKACTRPCWAQVVALITKPCKRIW